MLTDSLPTLSRFSVDNNELLAIPTQNSRITSANDAIGNLLQCSGLTPTAVGCVCASGLYVSQLCGYTRCTETPNGCPAEQFLNSSNCTIAPWSACVAPSQALKAEQYYNTEVSAFLPVTRCATAYPNPDTTATSAFIPSYKYANSSVTSNTICSICSSCPAEYRIVACTPTSNTQCTKEEHISPATIASIVLAIAIVVALAVLVSSVLYQRKEQQRRELRATRGHLEFTERTSLHYRLLSVTWV